MIVPTIFQDLTEVGESGRTRFKHALNARVNPIFIRSLLKDVVFVGGGQNTSVLQRVADDL